MLNLMALFIFTIYGIFEVRNVYFFMYVFIYTSKVKPDGCSNQMFCVFEPTGIYWVFDPQDMFWVFEQGEL